MAEVVVGAVRLALVFTLEPMIILALGLLVAFLIRGVGIAVAAQKEQILSQLEADSLHEVAAVEPAATPRHNYSRGEGSLMVPEGLFPWSHQLWATCWWEIEVLLQCLGEIRFSMVFFYFTFWGYY